MYCIYLLLCSFFRILVSWWVKVLNFKEVQFISWLVFFCFHLWNLYLPQCHEANFPMFSFKSFIFSPFILRSIIHLVDSCICMVVVHYINLFWNKCTYRKSINGCTTWVYTLMNIHKYTLCNYPLAQEIERFHHLRGIYHILMFSEIGMFYILSVYLMWEVPPPLPPPRKVVVIPYNY